MKPSITLQSGQYFDYLHPEASTFTIEDIARSLSRICRFGGHTREFYSVAQHSVYVAEICPREFRMQGLLHDAHEAFIGDMPMPLKTICPDYVAIEHRVEAAVRERFGLPAKLDDSVKVADMRMLARETLEFMPTHTDEEHAAFLNEFEPGPRIYAVWEPKEAYTRFLYWYNAMTACPENYARPA